MTNYYCTKNPKCPTKTLDTAPVNAPTCCDTPMTTEKNKAACWNNTNTTADQNMNTTPKKDSCCS